MPGDTRKEIAYKYLCEQIISCRLPPGAPIVEQEVSAALGISRTPVREALKQLEAEGLVRHVAMRGTFVAEVTTQDVEEIFVLREALEIIALREAIKHIPNEELEDLAAKLRSLTTESPREEFFESDRRLHDLIVRYAGNRRLAVFLNTLNNQVERLRRISAMRPSRLMKSAEEHLAIAEAVKARDLERSERLLQQHIRNVKESTLEVCRSSWL